ncbi:hypothetical protein [Shewanella xiamenensis]|uniref:hypothetical protein n=1 Tax=Shewanella xiamenensis TaxID=332186 RepID=UPI00214FEF03|nr:hypothetical protein [Shewanella xiamenensis]MCR4535484.1 hypothetical protein [Shewanella xiamenensis]
MKTSTEMLIALSEIELTLAVAKAKFALIDSEVDQDIVNMAWSDSFYAGMKFDNVLSDFACYFQFSHSKLRAIIDDITCQLSAMPKYLRTAFEFGQCDACIAELGLEPFDWSKYIFS